MLMAVMDQSWGDSTSRCSKMVLPLASVMLAVRRSHSTSSYGETPARVKMRGNFSPGAVFCLLVDSVVCVVLVVGSAIFSLFPSSQCVPLDYRLALHFPVLRAQGLPAVLERRENLSFVFERTGAKAHS